MGSSFQRLRAEAPSGGDQHQAGDPTCCDSRRLRDRRDKITRAVRVLFFGTWSREGTEKRRSNGVDARNMTKTDLALT
jgi:hypothetical protein